MSTRSSCSRSRRFSLLRRPWKNWRKERVRLRQTSLRPAVAGLRRVEKLRRHKMIEPHDIIKTAWLTEKSTLMSEKKNKYVFRVSPKANKIQIKNAIERLFQKTVVDVNTCNYAGKEKRLRGPLGRRPHWKKAIVTLAEGEKIDLV